ncbi:MAG: DMT family transporter [Pseudomonadota bacterium]
MALFSSPITMALLGVFLGTFVDALVKGLAEELPILTILTWRFVFGGIVTLGVYVMARRPWPGRADLLFHLLRGAIQALAGVSFFWALTQLALVEAIVLGFTAGLMVPPVARVLLGERMRSAFVGAGGLGFAGAVLASTGDVTAAPADGNRGLGIAAALFSSLTYALALVMLRMASRRGDALTTIMFSNVMPVVFLVPILLGVSAIERANVPILPTPGQLWFIFGLALLGVVTWGLLTKAYAMAPAQRLAPLDYSSLVWGVLIGMVAFDEVPSLRLYVGAGLIILACLLVAFQSRFATRREAHLPPTDVQGG